MRNFPYFILFRTAWRYAGGHRASFATGLSLICISQVVWLLQPYFLGLFINAIQNGALDPAQFSHIAMMGLLYFSVSPVSWLMHGPGRVLERQAGYYIWLAFMQEKYRQVMHLPLLWHQEHHSGSLIDRVRKAGEAIKTFSSQQYAYVMLAFNFFGPMVMLTLLFGWIGLFAAIAAFIALFIISRFDRKLVPLYEQSNNVLHHANGILSDYLGNVRTIITLRLQQATQQEYANTHHSLRKPYWEEYRWNEYKWAVVEVVVETLIISLILLTVWRMQHGSTALQVGSLVTMMTYLWRFGSAFSSMAGLYQDMVRGAADLRSAQIIDDADARYHALASDDAALPVGTNWQKIAVQNLSFSYQDVDGCAHALQDLAFQVKRGQKIALVGASGAGKSTLMALLRGLHPPDKVALTVDDVAYHSMAPLQQLTTLIPQDPEIFDNKIRYNITFGIEHSEKEILWACQLSGFDSVLEQLPDGLNTDIRERGVNLSGGQKQRLALARGVFSIQASTLVLLDEPTSSVDTVTEGQIFTQLFNAFPDKAMIASIHRLHLLSRFDHIIVLDQGRIVQQGGFAELSQQPGALQDLMSHYQNELQESIS